MAAESEVLGLEVAGFEAPDDELERRAAASTALEVIEPVLEALGGGAGGDR